MNVKYAVSILQPPDYPHAAAFADVAESLRYGLDRLGHDAVVGYESGPTLSPGRRHIVLGSNLLPHMALELPRDAILYNLEQVAPGSPWFPRGLLALFRQHVLWDYSPNNASRLRGYGVPVAAVLPLGYAPTLSRIERSENQDIDVLFCGSRCVRRTAVLASMRAAGLRVVEAFNCYGAERDALIARAKVVLNLHFYAARVLEQVRLQYLLANRCAVLSEYGEQPEEDRGLFGGAVEFCEYHNLVDRAHWLVHDEAWRRQLSVRGFSTLRERPIEVLLMQPLLMGAAKGQAA